MTAELVAIRSVRTEAKAHLLAPWHSSFGTPTKCGRALSNHVRLAWGDTAPDKRCIACSKIAQEDAVVPDDAAETASVGAPDREVLARVAFEAAYPLADKPRYDDPLVAQTWREVVDAVLAALDEQTLAHSVEDDAALTTAQNARAGR